MIHWRHWWDKGRGWLVRWLGLNRASLLPSPCTGSPLPDPSSAATDPLPSVAATGEACLPESTQHTLASLPLEILALVHSRVCQADPSLRSCLCLEASCKGLRSLLLSNTRFEQVCVEAGQLGAAQQDASTSFWTWIAAHGSRTDVLLFKDLELTHSTPKLCSKAGVLQAGAVAVSAAVIDTLEPLRGLLNLAAVDCTVSQGAETGNVSLDPLAGLPALERAHLDGRSFWDTLSMAPRHSIASTLTSLRMASIFIPQLDELQSLSKLESLRLLACFRVTSMAPLSCLTSLTKMVLLGFGSLESVGPLRALSRLQHLVLAIHSARSFSLEPLRQLTSLTYLSLAGSGPDDHMPGYDLQPLSALSSTLLALNLQYSVLHNLPAIGSLGMTLRFLTLTGCICPPGFHLASLLNPLSCLVHLDVSDATAEDLVAIGSQLTGLVILRLKRSDNVTSLAALIPLTQSLRAIRLESCNHVSSVDPLTALTALQTLRVISCPQLTSLSPLTALQSLQQLRPSGRLPPAGCLPARKLAAASRGIWRPVLHMKASLGSAAASLAGPGRC
jgi:hypothetical protein